MVVGAAGSVDVLEELTVSVESPVVTEIVDVADKDGVGLGRRKGGLTVLYGLRGPMEVMKSGQCCPESCGKFGQAYP